MTTPRLNDRTPIKPALVRTSLLAFGITGMCGGLAAQSTLPPMPATSIAPLSAAPVVAANHAQRPQVSCGGGQVSVKAQNASLNSILREISRCTGMKITGGVADSRVFGDYGPAAAGTVLSTLLDGTGSNMVLRETADASPAELVLTPRGGGPTPPNPAANRDDDDVEAQPQQPPQFGQPLPRMQGSIPQPPQGAEGNGTQPFNVNGSPNNQSPTAANYPTTNSVPVDALSQPSTTPSTSGIVDSPNPPAPGSTTAAQLGQNFGTTSASTDVSTAPTTSTTSTSTTGTSTTGTSATGTGSGTGSAVQSSPNGVPTPEQIYQELQKLKQQTTPQ